MRWLAVIAVVLVTAACGDDGGDDAADIDARVFPTTCGPALTCNEATEICVVTTPVGPGESYACVAVPGECTTDRSCACVGFALCTGTFDTCTNRPDPNTIACECPACQ